MTSDVENSVVDGIRRVGQVLDEVTVEERSRAEVRCFCGRSSHRPTLGLAPPKSFGYDSMHERGNGNKRAQDIESRVTQMNYC